jgi:CRISPR/Cas system CSM-associated protein Csm2 small subunit
MNKNLHLDEEEVKKALNINSFREINKAKVFELFQMSSNIDKETYIKIIEQIPNFVTIAKEFLESTSQVTEASKTLSKQSKEILNGIANNANELLKKDNLDKEEKLKLIELLSKIVDKIDTFDERDKNYFKDIVKEILSFGKFALGIIGVICGVKFFKGGGKE